MTNQKVCKHCKKEKSLEDFFQNKKGKFGRHSVCKECYAIRKKDGTYQYDLEKIRKREKSEKYILMRKKWYKENKNSNEYREQAKEAQSKYRKRHPDRIKEYDNRPEVKIKSRIACRIRLAIKGDGKKTLKSLELLGCDIAFFRKYIEEKFTEGMSWDNYGKWHLDHIIPCSSFNLLNIDEQKRCFHYTNQQPLWADDNLQKSNKIGWVKR